VGRGLEPLLAAGDDEAPHGQRFGRSLDPGVGDRIVEVDGVPGGSRPPDDAERQDPAVGEAHRFAGAERVEGRSSDRGRGAASATLM